MNFIITPCARQDQSVRCPGDTIHSRGYGVYVQRVLELTARKPLSREDMKPYESWTPY